MARSPQQVKTVGTRRTTRTPTVVVADDRPVVRAGLRVAVSGGDQLELVGVCGLGEVVRNLDRTSADVLVIGVRANDGDPFRVVATAKALRPNVATVVVAEAATALDLREAVVAGVDSFLLTTATLPELHEAIAATARGERIVAPEVAMQLASTWRPTGTSAKGAATLSARELEVLQLVAEGLTNQEIGGRLDLSPRTVKTHVQHLLTKLDAVDRTGAVATGFRLGLIR